MLFGEKSQLDYNTTKAFRNSGIAHMLAVSGLHTSLWCGLLIALLKLLRCKEQIRSLICVLFLTAFCIISGFTPSVVRASVMASSTLIAPLFKRKADSFNSLGLAITLLLVANPYVIHSISFQLSACATLGVLLSQETTSRINSIKYIPREKHLSHAFNYIISSVIISVFAGIFTLPVSAYHFGVFSIASPLSNIICVKPGFYGMITGIMGVILKAIPNTVTNSIGNILFNITELILDFVVMVATAISKLSFCTIPVHKHRLLPAIIIIGIIAFTGYVIYKLVHSKTAIKITAVICVLTMAISIAVPLCVTKYKSEITIINDCNNIHLIIRSGTHYAYISNTLGDTPDDVHDFLPKATPESLDYYISTYMSDYKTYQLSSIAFRYEPLETRITKRIYRACISSDNPVPKNAVIKTTGKYELSDEISFEIIDTTPTQYVIIKSPEKTAYIHLHGNTDLSAVTDISQGNIFVYKGTPPEVISNTVETVVLSADSAITADENLSYIKSRCENFYITALDGNITLTI